MIQPTVGRIVLYTPHHSERLEHEDGQHLAAIVTCVHSDTCVNLAVFDCGGTSHGRTSVTLVQEGDTKPEGAFCEWMPYQLGQAAKAEAVEASAAKTAAAPKAPAPAQKAGKAKAVPQLEVAANAKSIAPPDQLATGTQQGPPAA